jgi:Ca2+-binding RTX toxin-like protein
MIISGSPTSGNDVIVCDGQNDIVNGFGGDDQISGAGGNDILSGDEGSDTLFGGTGNDTLRGGTGNDRVEGGDDNDRLQGNAGDDTLFGGAGNDVLIGGDGSAGSDNDVINGDAGDDEIITTDANTFSTETFLLDRLDGGAGNDTLSANFSNQTADITFISGQSNDIIFADGTFAKGFENIRYFTSGSGNDRLIQKTILTPWPNDGFENRISMGAGNDTIDAGLGVDSIDGGIGDDLLILDYSIGDDANMGGLSGSAAGSSASSDSSFSRRNTTTNISRDSVSGRGFERYQITGTSKADTFTGWMGNDTLTGGAGNDTITSFFGNDIVDAGAGDDDVISSYESGTFNPFRDTQKLDQLDGGDGNDTLSADFGNQTDNITFSSGQTNDLIFADGTYAKQFENLRFLVTGTGDDRLIQLGRLNNRFITGTGSDVVNAGLGTDTLDGGGGDDLLIVDYSTGDPATMGAMQSSVSGTSASFSRFDSTTGISDGITANNFERYQITGGSKNDSLAGGTGNDTIRGGAGNDTIRGQDGNDDLAGGAGNDSLTGGTGTNRYLIGSGNPFAAADIGIDTIADFQAGRDKFILDPLTFNAGSTFANVATDADVATSNAFIVYSQATGNLFYNPDGSTLGLGTGAQFATLTNRPTLTAADLGLTFTPGVGSISQAQVDQLIAGVTQSFAGINGALGSQVFAEQLPLLGSNLQTVFNGGSASLQYLLGLRDAVLSGLNSLSGGGYTAAQVQNAINVALANFGIDGVVETANGTATDVSLTFNTSRQFNPFSIALATNLGLPNLGFSASGNAQAKFGYSFKFGMGVDASGFYLDTSANTQFKINSTTILPGLNANAKLGFLNLIAADNGTNFLSNYDIDLKDANNDGKLRLSELAGAPDLLDANLSGSADAKINLQLTLPAGSGLPKLQSNLGLLWNFNNAAVDPLDNNLTFGDAPKISLYDSKLNLGDFFSGFAGDTLRTIKEVTDPMKPVIDFLTTPIPILSDLGSSKVTILDIFDVSPSTVAAIEGLKDISDLANLVGSFATTGNILIDLGSASLTGDLRIDSLDNLALNVLRIPALPGSQNANLGQFFSGVNSLGGGGLSFPIITDPTAIGQLLLGQNVDLFKYTPAPLNILDYEFKQFFPVFGPIGINLGGKFGLSAQFGFGYDTQGLKDYFTSGGTDITKVGNGLYVIAFDNAAKPVTGFTISAGVIAGVAANFGILEVGVDGDITADVGFYLSSALADLEGKVRGKTIASTIASSPLALFEPSGEVTAGLRAYLELGISPFSIDVDFESPRVTLLTFNKDNLEPVIATEDSGILRLNVGPRSALRLHGNIKDGPESFLVTKNENPFFSDFVLVTAFKTTKSYRVSSQIVADGGDRADELLVDPLIEIPIQFTGGAGPDSLRGARAGDSLSGDADADKLDGGDSNDTLRGGTGNDILIGGSGGDVLDGGDGVDTASYQTSTVGMLIDLRTNQFTGDGVRDTFISIERYEGTNFNDTINGNDDSNPLLRGLDGNDTIQGFAGNDVLDGGAGDDSLVAGDNDDFLVGGTGADVLDGGAGVDTIAYTSSKTPVAVSLKNQAGTGGDAQGDQLISVEILLGSPLLFGDVNTLTSATSGDTLEGSDVDNQISGLGGSDFISGLSGNDLLYGDMINASAPPVPGLDNDTIDGGDGNDTLFGQGDNDVLDGGFGQDNVDGGEGDDFLKTFDPLSVDTLEGGAGNNRLSADYSDQTVKIDFIAGQTQTYEFSNGDIARQFQKLGDFYTGSGNDLIRLDGAGDEEYNNILQTNGGQDTIYSGSGRDSVSSGDGDDFVNGGRAADNLNGGLGADTVDYSTSPSEVIVDLSTGVTDGGYLLQNLGGSQGYSLSNIAETLSTTVVPSTGIVTITGTDLVLGFENIIGSNFRDNLIGSSGDNMINPGLPILSNYRYNFSVDFVDGGAGKDLLVVDYSSVTVGILTGATFEYSIRDGSVLYSVRYSNMEYGLITATNNNDNVYGFAGALGNDTLNGLGGDDTLYGGIGNFNNFGNDVINGGDGNDEIGNRDYVNALSIDNDLFDRLDGGTGNDTLSAEFTNQTADITFISGQSNDIIFADGTYAKGFENIRYFTSGSGNDRLIQKTTLTTLPNANSENSINMGAGNDTVDAGLGIDSIDGGIGDDLLILDYSIGDDANMGGLSGSAGGSSASSDSSFSRRNTTTNIRRDSVSGRGFERYQITGTSKADTFTGWIGNDTLTGGAGNDTITAYYGSDSIDGGSGDDEISSSYDPNAFITQVFNDTQKFDQIDGGLGNDTLTADNSNQTADITFISGQSNDIIFADGSFIKGIEHLRSYQSGSGNDSITQLGRFGNNFNTGAGNDTVNAGLGNDSVQGGDGNDVLIVDYSVGDDANAGQVLGSGVATNLEAAGYRRRDTSITGLVFLDSVTVSFAGGSQVNIERFQVTSGSKDDNFSGGVGNDTLSGGAGSDTLQGLGGNDYLNGGAGNDALDGGQGSDILIGGNGDLDTLTGGSGDDVYEVYTGNTVTEAAGGGIDWVYANNDYILGANQENLILWESGNINGTGNAENNVLYGNVGNNQLNGGAGIDYLLGGGGNDTLNAGTGNDYLNGGVGNDSLDGGEGSDILIGSNGDLDTLVGGAGDDVYEVYTGNVITEAAGEGRDWVYANNDYILGANQENLILWESGNINGTGNSENNALYGNVGNNQLNSGAGIDYLLGGDGNDTLTAGDGNDYLNSGAGNDALDGGEGSDILIGSNGDLDTLVGGAGDDVYEVYTGNTVTETAGGGIDWVYAVVDYTLGANLENLVLWETANINGTGNSEDNYLYGNVGNNQLAGGTGNDSLFGGAGNDSLTGGLGNDEFIFRGVFGTLAVDVITDFTLSVDKIALSKTTFNLASTVTAGVNFGFSIAGEFASVSGSEDTSNALIVYNSSTGGLFYNQNGSNAGFGTGGQFAVITASPALVATDFKIVG